jgi:L,D-transpeptidase catalytic domain
MLASTIALLVAGVLAAPPFFSAAASTSSPGPVAAVKPALASAPTAPRTGAETRPASHGFQIARPAGDRAIVLRSRPGGSVLATVVPRTEFGSRLALGVVKRRGDWIGVASIALGNGRVGWMEAADVRLSRTRVSLRLDLSKRLLVLKEGVRVVRRITVGIGRAEAPTPIGRFAVTDKLAGWRFSAYYGCCILALSAKQPNLPRGWTEGDRIAVHGTNDPASIGASSSAGCPHASDADMRVLMRRVPLGAPVFIRP